MAGVAGDEMRGGDKVSTVGAPTGWTADFQSFREQRVELDVMDKGSLVLAEMET